MAGQFGKPKAVERPRGSTLQNGQRGLVRRSTQKVVSKADAMEQVLQLVATGSTVDQAAKATGRTAAAVKNWMREPEFQAAMRDVRAAREKKVQNTHGVELPDFPEFSDRYLKNPLFPHQINAWDVISGRPPRFFHPSMQYEKGSSGRTIINFPPNHSKSTTWSMDFLTYLIHLDPGITIAVVSKTQNFAKKLLAGIKARLTSSVYREMQIAFAPEGGWRDPDASWTTTMIYVQGKYVGETEKDPTVEAIGMKGQIYGGRFRVIVLDDVVDKTNSHQWEDQSDWVMTELDSRLPPDGGLILCLGTRLASTDLYSTLREKRDEQDRPFFTYFAQPAVLDYGDGPSDTWDTLWPWQTISASKVLAEVDGDAEARTRWPWESEIEKERDARKVCVSCYEQFDDDAEHDACTCDHPLVRWCVPRWTGQNLAQRRFPLGERRWGLVWQQLQVPDNATFNQRTLMTSINRMRTPGVALVDNQMGHRRGGMAGLYVVGGLDPATVGYTAIIVSALDRDTGKRWVLDAVNIAGMRPQDMRDTIERLTKRYGINEWVIERNAFQKFLTDDPALKRILQAAGCKLTPHFTGTEKVDPDFGIMSLAPLFESTGEPPDGHPDSTLWKRVKEGDLIELPDDRQAAWVSTLISQLIAWEPSGMSAGQKTDLVMALWFTDLAFKRILDRGRRTSTHLPNPFLTTMRKADRKVINLQEARNALMDARAAASA